MSDSSSATPTEDDFVFIEVGKKVYQFLKNKNEELQRKRGLSFTSVIPQLATHDIAALVDANQEKHPGHQIYVLDINGYLYEVPFLAQQPNIIFLKSIYPSRKMMRDIWGVPRKSKKLKKRLKREGASNVSISVEAVSISVSIKKEYEQ